MIRFERVTITYPDAEQPALRDVDLVVPAGELCIVIGATGSGKSTLLGAINGLVPHFTGGELRGAVTVDGRDTRTHPPRELADLVGVVTQDPLAGCVTDTLEEELAYGMEQLAIPPEVMRKRVEETLDLLGLAELRNRALFQLSAGQLQRVAIGAVLTAHPKVLVLDEPTSALDPTGAEEVIATITRLVHDLGVTVVMAEHRLERVVQYADRIVHLGGDGRVEYGEPAEVLAHSSVAPPIVELGRLAGWKPLPLSVRDARRQAVSLTAELAGVTPPPAVAPPAGTRPAALEARGIIVRFGAVVAVRDVDIELNAGEIVALMGRNGAGKSSLLWAIQGSGARHGGRVDVSGRDPADLGPAESRARVGLVPQTPSDLLYLDSVDEELARADAESRAEPGSSRVTLDRIAPGIAGPTHPRDLSEGQRLALVLAVQLAARPAVLLLDEPTRGLDYSAKHELGLVLRALADSGHAIAIATHDVEFVAVTAHRVVVMAEGEIVADGPTENVIVASPAFAPQVAKIVAPRPWLTVEQLRNAGVFTDRTPDGEPTQAAR
jgi:energy-coupling factor transport system ATP-binding protein